MAAPASPLLDQLRRNALAEAAAHVEAAHVEGERVRAAAALEAAVHHAEVVAARESDVAVAFALATAEAAQQVRFNTLTARAEALDRIFAAAAAQLPAFADHPDLGAVVGRSIVQALRCVPAKGAVVRCNRAVADAVAPLLDALGVLPELVVVDDTVPLGVRVASADGGVLVDATFARRLERDRAALAIAVAQQLTGPPS